jgi:hypothetical protein
MCTTHWSDAARLPTKSTANAAAIRLRLESVALFIPNCNHGKRLFCTLGGPPAGDSLTSVPTTTSNSLRAPLRPGSDWGGAPANAGMRAAGRGDLYPVGWWTDLWGA